MFCGSLYLVTCLPTGQYYVGKTVQSVQRRWAGHKTHAKTNNGSCPHLHNAINLYGHENFVVETLATTDSEEKMNNLEQLWIASFNARDPKVGYNIAAGGDKVRTGPLSEQHKKNISISHKGKKRPPFLYTKEHRANIARTNLGNIANLTSGKLTALWYCGPEYRPPKWVCACECGRLAMVAANNIRSGHTTSCGCHRREVTRKLGLTPFTEEEKKRMSVAQKKRFQNEQSRRLH